MLLVPALLLQQGCANAMERRQVTFQSVVDEARRLASDPYREEQAYLPGQFRDMEYDRYRDVRFRPEKALWAAEGLPFQVQLFHRGYLFEDPVYLYEFTDTHVQELPYVRDFFRFDRMDIKRYPRRDSGYAGWRLHAPLNNRAYFDEVIAFLGASYFRAVGHGQSYGLSARALLLPHRPGEPEEFPRFTRFWLRKPDPASRSMTAFALLDSPSVAGACKFIIRPGAPTGVEIEIILFPRKPLDSVGLGALTSMFYFGENTQPKPRDFRPEVHDSDGLLLEYADGTRKWRPLDAGPLERLSRFEGSGLTAFGLYQRDRDFHRYLDMESRYHTRPSVRVTLLEGFRNGQVLLRELPPEKEFFDNIVAAFHPDEALLPGRPHSFRFRMDWGSFAGPTGLGTVLATRHGENIHDPGEQVFLVRFSLPESVSREHVELRTGLSGDGRITESRLEFGPDPGTARAHLHLASGTVATRLSAVLVSGGKPVTETWLYRWNPYN